MVFSHVFPINKCYSVIIFSLLNNAVILLFNCLVLIFHVYMNFLSPGHLDLYVCDTTRNVSQSLYCLTLVCLMVLTVFPGCVVQASLMLFLVPGVFI